MITRLITTRAILLLGPITIFLLSVVREKKDNMLTFSNIVCFSNKI